MLQVLRQKRLPLSFLLRAVGFVQHNLWSNKLKRKLLEGDQSGPGEVAGPTGFQRK